MMTHPSDRFTGGGAVRETLTSFPYAASTLVCFLQRREPCGICDQQAPSTNAHSGEPRDVSPRILRTTDEHPFWVKSPKSTLTSPKRQRGKSALPAPSGSAEHTPTKQLCAVIWSANKSNRPNRGSPLRHTSNTSPLPLRLPAAPPSSSLAEPPCDSGMSASTCGRGRPGLPGNGKAAVLDRGLASFSIEFTPNCRPAKAA